MAVDFVQSKSVSSTGATSTTIAVTLTTNVTAGNLLAVYAAWNTISTGSVFVSCADGLGNTFTTVDSPTFFSGDLVRTFYAKNINAGSCTVTVTITPAGGYRMLLVHEISGADTSAPLDQHIINSQTGPGNGTNALTTTALTTTTNGQYIFAACHVHNVGVGKTIAAGSGFTPRESIDAGADSTPLESEEQIQTSAGSIAATFTGTLIVGDDVSTAMMTFKAAGGGSTPITVNTLGVDNLGGGELV